VNQPGQYCIFLTVWGYFGFSAVDGRITRTCLPCREETLVMQTLLDAGLAEYNSRLLPDVQQGIIAYFQGKPFSFNTIALLGQAKTQFAEDVYTALCTTSPGMTVSYSELASMAGHLGAARAVGHAMATNPLPLIVPCHRVVNASGRIGGFSAEGGVTLKKRLLQHEKDFWGGSSA